MFATTKLSCLAAVLVSINLVQCQRPVECDEHRTIQNELSRSLAVPSDDTTRSCDSGLKGWHRFLPIRGTTGRVDLIWKNPELGLYKCGTRFPIYLNADTDPLPKTLFEKKSIKACQYFGDHKSLKCVEVGPPVDITNCGDYNVYNIDLPSTTPCPAAFCTSTKTPCPAGTFSTDGFQPGCTDQVPIYTGKPVVEYQVDHRNNELLFFCNDNGVTSTNNFEHFRQINWYMTRANDITGRPTLVRETKGLKIRVDHLLTENNWRADFSLGVDITCEIKGFTSQDVPGDTAISDVFYAGLTATPELLEIRGDNKGMVKITPTVPVLCPMQFIANNVCTQKLRVSVITRDHASTTCANGDFNGNIVIPTACGTEIIPLLPNEVKDQSVFLNVQGRQPDVFNGNAASSLSLTVNRQNGFAIWRQKLPDISIKVLNENAAVAGKVCQSNNDPHMITFAGRRYELQEAGTFILYKHETLPLQVQATYQRCHPPYTSAFCNCGVAVQSGRDVFVYDLCKKELFNRVVQFLRVGVLGCDNKAMVINKQTNNAYEIILPTGTKIKVSPPYQAVNNEAFVNNIHITPTAADFGFNTIGGVCGVIVPQNGQDMKPKGATAATQIPVDFFRSWKVTNNKENLFLSPQLVDDDSFTLPSQCECKQNPNNPLDTEAFCDASVAGTKCNIKDDETLLRVCNAGKRRKREILEQADTDIFADKFTFPDEGGDDGPARPCPTCFPTGWTENTARKFCNDFLNQNAPAECLALANLNYEFLLEGCVMDIKAIGTTDFALGNLQVLLRDCVLEIVSNNTVIVEVDPSNPDPTPRPTPMKHISVQAEQILKKICPGACNMKGNCIDGRCQCNDGYSGTDCAIDLNKAPSDLLLLNNGVCDLQKRSCMSTIVYGKDISTARAVSCVVKEYVFEDFSGHQDRKTKVAEYQIPATVMSTGQVKCALRRTTPGRPIYIYEIALTNGGAVSESEEMIVFDSNCYSINENPTTKEKTPHVKDNVCIIDSVCHAAGTVNAQNSEEICKPVVDPFSWSANQSEITNFRDCFKLPITQRAECFGRFVSEEGQPQ